MHRFLFPIFLPFTLWYFAGCTLEYFLTDWDHIKDTGPSNSPLVYLFGTLFILPTLMVLQLTLGLFLLWMLKNMKSFWACVVLGTVVGILLGVSCIWLFRVPGDGFTTKGAVLFLLAFVLPFATGCGLSFWFAHPASKAS